MDDHQQYRNTHFAVSPLEFPEVVRDQPLFSSDAPSIFTDSPFFYNEEPPAGEPPRETGEAPSLDAEIAQCKSVK